MKTNIYTIRKKVVLVFLIFISSQLCMSEGTKQLMPLSSDYGNLQIYDGKRSFAAYYNADPMHRLYFHVAATSEKVYFGFRHIVQSGINNSTTQFRIKDPSGAIVYASTNIPTTSGSNGYIENYEAAVAGPKVSGSPSNGYKPFLFTPATTGDFYIEFSTDTSQGTYHLDYFDLTIINADRVRLTGRLWSYCWDISTRSFNNGFNATMYVLTDDYFVSRADFNGILAYGFTLACNSTGPSDLPGGNNENRKSIEGNSVRPQYKIFLNNPDLDVYPSGEIPEVIENLDIASEPIFGEEVIFTVNISQPGIVEIILDINEFEGYQPDSRDVILIKNVHAGLDSIIWDGKDGFGEYVEAASVVVVLSSFASGTTHLPLFDPETHPEGYIVNRVRPITGSCDLYWDDSNFEGGVVNIDGSLTTGHSWEYFFGNERTMNTWWNGYELDILNNFNFSIGFPLPVELIYFELIPGENQVALNWAVENEINNDYYVIEKSSDAVNFVQVGVVPGLNNITTLSEYSFVDYNPFSGISYYRIMQIDFNGEIKYSEIEMVNLTSALIQFDVYPNPVRNNEYLHIRPNVSQLEYYVIIYTLDGTITDCFVTNDVCNYFIEPEMKHGVYYVVIRSINETIIKSFVVQ